MHTASRQALKLSAIIHRCRKKRNAMHISVVAIFSLAYVLMPFTALEYTLSHLGTQGIAYGTSTVGLSQTEVAL
ncbi:hypothetical protein KTT_15370 [Tengunoibacter tsumagoiensis]|uniref:Uncharacterized protein n=1 Tax=Tengunoibacter tsumagoiensis TaxID=2014871 RepID=A0A401ZXT6_9CHLR|nr:hypothetical protein KTT_15370 [Tengunoibacter tsumagoiensis]